MARVNRCPVHRALGQRFDGNDFVLRRQKNPQKSLAPLPGEEVPAVVENRLFRAEDRPPLEMGLQVEVGGLLQQGDERGRTWADVLNGLEVLDPRIKDRPKGAEIFDECLGVRLHVSSRYRKCQQQFQHLVVVES